MYSYKTMQCDVLSPRINVYLIIARYEPRYKPVTIQNKHKLKPNNWNKEIIIRLIQGEQITQRQHIC
jgi:hypothetical protein